nr:IclR family transcriptional regulator [Pseudonocardia acaciae]
MSSERPLGPVPPKSVLARGLRLLDAFGPADTELSLAELSARTGLPKPTAYRLLRQLLAWGGVEQTPGGGYRLGLRLFTLGQQVPRQRELRRRALPYLEDLYEATHENVHLAVYHGTDTLFLEKLTGHRSTPIVSRPGSRLPGHCTATGKVFLALGPPERLHRTLDGGLSRLTPRTIVLAGMLRRELDRTRDRGYAVNVEESEIGVVAVAAPVLDGASRVIASISVTGGTHQIAVERLAPTICVAAKALSRELATASAS